ncbi:thiamine phosphate synthase [Prevotella sp.]|jgi:thiamine-phosphate pyrophosphorylase|uniref:thiamine phosphate synthase n=1 Tax=uncultured Prevotella sp. TaxID=159272 RepID=UPI00261FB377|nr:thiamine phosphate synthase [uncultured Prevotella sp.]
MKLVIMTKPTFFVEEDKILTTLFEEGMENLHIHKPESSPMYSERLLSLLSENYYRKITVHDHYYLKTEYNLGSIHIDDPASPVPEGYKGKYSRTCTELSQLKDFKKKSEYVFLKGVFDSLSEPGTKSHFTNEELEKAAQNGLIDRHVYAMGGMNLENIRTIKELGFGGIVICGDLWNRFDIHNEIDYKRLINHFEKLRKSIS